MIRLSQHLLWCVIIFLPHDVAAHGSIIAGEDICELEIGYLKAHFKVYLPRTHQRKEFCEDLPAVTESLFIMEYGNEQLSSMMIDFRIIRDVTGLEKFVREEHIAGIDDLESATVFYQPPSIEPDVYSVVVNFMAPGWYVGIVTASLDDAVYTAVFPFEAGFTGVGYWPYFAALIAAFLLFVWYDRRREQRESI